MKELKDDRFHKVYFANALLNVLLTQSSLKQIMCIKFFQYKHLVVFIVTGSLRAHRKFSKLLLMLY